MPDAIAAFVASALAETGSERSRTQAFWLALLRDVFEVPRPEAEIRFEVPVSVGGATKFVDAYLPRTRVLIEQKGQEKDLASPGRQSDGTNLTPFQQAKRYADALEYSRRPRWIVTSNFDEIRIHDLDRPNPEADPEIILLADLPTQWKRLTFLVDPGDALIRREQELSVRAGGIVGRLHAALAAAPDAPDDHALNILCVRLVFCLYAEDAGIFGGHKPFCRYVRDCAPHQLADALQALFDVLDTPEAERRTKNPVLQAFPYVNGGLFSREELADFPRLDAAFADLLVDEAGAFDWREISPTIFGAVFESTLNPETRRRGGMHYTSVENIHRVIDPLFLDDLRAELAKIRKTRAPAALNQKLGEYIGRLASLRFLDPACGSGNFLTETYICLRRLENEALEILHSGRRALALPIRVKIGQFAGIEINGFAVAVARTALWIAESQMHAETADFCRPEQDLLPLRDLAGIVEGNALRLDWPEADYIMGNPPFVGKKEQTPEQKAEFLAAFEPPHRGLAQLDYVCAWFSRAERLMRENGRIRAAFVATNSITQGEQAAILWKRLFAAGLRIQFARRTFRWDSESRGRAHVHCVVIGFGMGDGPRPPRVYDDDGFQSAGHINQYLVDAENVFLEGRAAPLCDVPGMAYGSMPIDSGHLILDGDDVRDLLRENPENGRLVREYAGGDELINGRKRWCLWLAGVPASILRKSAFVAARVEANRRFRLSSSREATRRLADTPALFGEIRQPSSGRMLAIPKVSGERREYIPMAFVSCDIIVSGSALIVPDAGEWHFSILTSSVHNAWMRTVGGRLKSDYQYSAQIVYNTFPWPEMTEAQRERIAALGRAVLDARSAHPDDTLADLYDPAFMPPDLRRVHRALDGAVLALYGLKAGATEPEIVAELFRQYATLVCKNKKQ